MGMLAVIDCLQGYQGLCVPDADCWRVPGPGGQLLDEIHAAPPVAKVTAIYGINLPTIRTIFLRHRPVHVSGGAVDVVQSPLVLDDQGNSDGLLDYNGQGHEISAGAQLRPDTGEQVFCSGDGTVNYYSLRHAATWNSDNCTVEMIELPGCNHRGVSSDPRMLSLLRDILGLKDTDHETIRKSGDNAIREGGRCWGGATRWCSAMLCILVVAKTGFVSLNVQRKRFSRGVQLRLQLWGA